MNRISSHTTQHQMSCCEIAGNILTSLTSRVTGCYASCCGNPSTPDEDSYLEEMLLKRPDGELPETVERLHALAEGTDQPYQAPLETEARFAREYAVSSTQTQSGPTSIVHCPVEEKGHPLRNPPSTDADPSNELLASADMHTGLASSVASQHIFHMTTLRTAADTSPPASVDLQAQPIIDAAPSPTPPTTSLHTTHDTSIGIVQMSVTVASTAFIALGALLLRGR